MNLDLNPGSPLNIYLTSDKSAYFSDWALVQKDANNGTICWPLSSGSSFHALAPIFVLKFSSGGT